MTVYKTIIATQNQVKKLFDDGLIKRTRIFEINGTKKRVSVTPAKTKNVYHLKATLLEIGRNHDPERCIRDYVDHAWTAVGHCTEAEKKLVNNIIIQFAFFSDKWWHCLLYTSPSPRD